MVCTLICPFSTKSLLHLHDFLLTLYFFQSTLSQNVLPAIDSNFRKFSCLSKKVKMLVALLLELLGKSKEWGDYYKFQPKYHITLSYGGFYHVAKINVKKQLKNRGLHRFGLIRNLALIQDDSFMY